MHPISRNFASEYVQSYRRLKWINPHHRRQQGLQSHQGMAVEHHQHQHRVRFHFHELPNDTRPPSANFVMSSVSGVESVRSTSARCCMRPFLLLGHHAFGQVKANPQTLFLRLLGCALLFVQNPIHAPLFRDCPLIHVIQPFCLVEPPPYPSE